MRQAGTRLGVLLAIAAGALGAGCGSGGDDDAATQATTASRGSAVLTPARADCAASALATDRRARRLTPAPGRYRYALAGRETSRGEDGGRRSEPLGPRSPLDVTPAIRPGSLVCFRLRRHLGPQLNETMTFVVRGSALYVSEFLLETRNGLVLVQPDPPVLALSPDELEWSGSFAGPTRGQYVGRLVGRRTMTIDGRRIRAVGVALDTSLAGEVRGTQHSVRWFALDGNLILSERVSEWRHSGIDRLRIDYRSRIASLRPERAG